MESDAKRTDGVGGDASAMPVSYLRCIHCGAAANELYHIFCGSIKLRECEQCGEFIDDLLEVEPMVIGVKLFLQRRQVYRHLCCNRGNEKGREKIYIPLQVPVTLLAMEVFLSWTLCCFEESFEETGDYFRWHLFDTTVRAICGWTIYFAIIYSAFARLGRNSGSAISDYSFSRIFYLITVSSFSKILNIGVTLWSPHEYLVPASYAVEFYWLLSQFRMLQCTLERSWLSALLLVSVAAWAKWAMATSSLPCLISNIFIDFV